MASGENISYMLSVVPGTMTGFASLNAGLASINNAFLQLTGAIDQSVGLANSMLITTGVVATQVAADAMNAFGQFEQSMKIVQMVSGQTADQMEYLSQKANEFSVQYRMDIDQITEGLQTLGRAGLNTASEQAEVLQNGLNTAKLEGRDLNSVLQELIQNTALLGGNLKSNDFGEQSEYVNDLLVSTSMTAPITTHDISETLKYSGGIAAAAGANIESDEGKRILEDYMGAIAAFAQKGVTGSIAGTALRAFFNKPATQDSSVTEALESIGLTAESLWQDGGEKMKPVSEQIGLIKSRMEELNISTMDQLQIWSKIVGGKMGQQMMKLDSDDIKTLTADIREANDAETLATNSMKTFQSNVKEIGEAGAAAFRDFGSKLVFFANPLLNALKPVVEFLQNDFMGWPLAIGFIGFIVYVARKIREVFSILRAEISSIWNLYKSGGSTTFKAWKENVLGGGSSSSKSEKSEKSSSEESGKAKSKTLASIAKDYRTQLNKSAFENYQKMGLSAKELTAINHVKGWTAYNETLGMSDAKALTSMIVNRVMPPQMLTDLADHGLKKKSFMSKYPEFEDLALQIKEIEQAANAAKKALQDETKANRKNSEEKKKNADENIITNEEETKSTQQRNQTVTESTVTTTSIVEKEWLAMCQSLTSSTAALKAFNPRYDMYSSPIGPEPLSGAGILPGGHVAPHIINDANKELDKQYQQYKQEVKKATLSAKYSPSEEPFVQGNEKITKDGSTYVPVNSRGINIFEKIQNPDGKYPYSGTYGVGNIPGLQEQLRLNALEQERRDAIKKAYDDTVKENEKISKEHQARVAQEKKEADERIKKGQQYREIREKNAASAAANPPSEHVGVPLSRAEVRDLQNRLDEERKRDALRKGPIEKPNTLAKGQQDAAAQAKKLNAERIKNEKAALSVSERVKAISQQRRVNEESAAKNSLSASNYWKNNTQHSIAAASEADKAAKKAQAQASTTVPITPWRDKWRNAGQSIRNTVSQSMIGNARSYLSDTYHADRTGKFLNFGAGRLGKTFNGLTNVGGKVVSFLGGPLMVAMMGITIAMQVVQNAYQEHTEKVKKAGDKLADAYSKLESAEDKLESSLKDANPGATSDEINEMVYETYAQITDDMQNHVQDYINKVAPKAADLGTYEYDEEKDDGSVKKVEEDKNSAEAQTEAINENTSALYAATAELSLAMDQYVREGMDSVWGIDAFGTDFSDNLGSIQDALFTGGEGSQYTDGNSFLLTTSQKDENYAGYTEMAGLMLEDFKDANGDWIEGLRRMMGKSVDDFAQIIPEDSKGLLNDLAQFSKGLGTADNLRLQQSMKRDKKTWQSLAKEIAKEENKTKKNVTKDTENKKIQGLIAKLQATMGNGFNKTQILQGAYLQQMQDMYSIAQTVMTPLIAQNAQSSAQNLLATQGVRQTTEGTGSSTYNTASITSVIAGYVAMIAQQSAKDATYDYALNMVPKTQEEKDFHNAALNAKDANDFYKQIKKQDEGIFGDGFWLDIDTHGLLTNHYGMDQYLKIYGSTAYQTAYGMSPDAANKRAEEYVKQARAAGNVTSTDILNTLAKNYQSGQFKDALVGAYLASDLGEDKSSGSDSGSGGSGDSDKDSGTKTKKERVDLVLCNKKEIPKLNVNLFKKAPSFTVLNKNFKLRDIKVNTEDKPKAILSSIKNAIIDVQKRSDPKIIQDESAEYDPVSATDGSSVPTGSTSTSTDG